MPKTKKKAKSKEEIGRILKNPEAFRELGEFIVELDIGFAKGVKLAFFIAHNFNIQVRKDARNTKV